MVSSRNPFQAVRDFRPGRSVFDLSYEKKFTGDMGILYPVLCEEVIPGDHFKLGNQTVVRFQPMVAPLMHEVNLFVHYYFVPYRLLMDDPEDWGEFITGGVDGETAVVLPTWEVSGGKNAKKTLWDFFGFPIGVYPPAEYRPLDFPRRAYNFVWNEYYRDENIQDEVALSNEDLLRRNWSKDFFTSSLPWQQRGQAPALPLTGVGSAVFNIPQDEDMGAEGVADSASGTAHKTLFVSGTPTTVTWAGLGTDSSYSGYRMRLRSGETADKNDALNAALSNNVVDFGDAVTFNVTDLRQVIAIQRFMEMNARGGVRYTEFLQAVFGVKPEDSRMMRPEYIGGSKTPIVFSEVLQTSSTDETSPQGNLAGHGISVDASYCGSYRAREHGLIIGLMSVMPTPSYNAQGIDRQWLRKDRYSFYHPAFANLSERGTEQAEIYATNVLAENETIFGFQGIFDEMRVKRSMVCSDMRDDFAFYHLARDFDTAPVLNSAFLECVPRKDIFAAPSEDGMIVTFGNIVRATRPLPIQSNPGLMDHVYGG